MRNRTILLITTAVTAAFGMFFALTAWLPTYYNETRGWSLAEGGFLISLLSFVGIFAVLMGGYLPLKIGSKRLFFIVPGAMAGLGGLGSFLVETPPSHTFPLLSWGLARICSSLSSSQCRWSYPA